MALSIPRLLAPIVRLEMMDWEPLTDGKALEQMDWVCVCVCVCVRACVCARVRVRVCVCVSHAILRSPSLQSLYSR